MHADSPVASNAQPAAPLIVAIDGPAGAGKSTVARHLAKHFGLVNLETGAMYRALALKAMQQSIDPHDANAVCALTASTDIRLEPGAHGNHVFLDGVEVTARLREPAVAAGASRVSVFPEVRHWMVEAQRRMGSAARVGVVMEGRDIGTVVFPDAPVKLFLDASVEARGDRRYLQQSDSAAGQESKDTITRQIAERDQRDRSREASPLRPAQDALRIDTTGLSLQAVLQLATSAVQNAINLRQQ